MKFIHFSDLHGDLESLIKLRERKPKTEKVDAYFYTGDSLGMYLSGRNSQIMHQAFNFITNTVQTNGNPNLSFDDILKSLIFGTERNITDNHREAAKIYSQIQAEFDGNAKKLYEKIAEEFEKFDAPVFAIPGNWDSPHFYKILEKYNIDNNIKDNKKVINGVSIAGVGGANLGVISIPQRRMIPYSEENLLVSLTENCSDIALTHVPPFGVLDQLEKGNCGSTGVLAYIRGPSPDLLLCGHNHKIGSCEEIHSKTTVSNAGNLGRFTEKAPFGSYMEIDYNEKRVICTPKNIYA